MSTLGKPQGIFDLLNSDQAVGSYISKQDIKTILGLHANELVELNFQSINQVEVIDERELQKVWYENRLTHQPKNRQVSLDEPILQAIIKSTLPNAKIETQVPVKRFRMDLLVTYNEKQVFVEFDGPTHFSFSKYGPPKNHPFRKKNIVESETGIEVVNWPYWIQRCSSNVRALFDPTVKGLGVLWSTKIHFGDFFFDDSAQIITQMNQRFNANRDGSCGYFYGPNTANRNNPEHPIIRQILSGRESVNRLLPKGFADKSKWLPPQLIGL